MTELFEFCSFFALSNSKGCCYSSVFRTLVCSSLPTYIYVLIYQCALVHLLDSQSPGGTRAGQTAPCMESQRTSQHLIKSSLEDRPGQVDVFSRIMLK